jgi:hypothetical protein
VLKGDLKAESVSEFLTRVAEIRKDFEFDVDDPWGPWFRGQQRVYWDLSPRLYRDYGGFERVKGDNIEDEIREEFIVRAPALSETRPATTDDWEWYFLMQHFGTPTRLLDSTDGALLALYFAVKDNQGSYSAAVWALDPYELNKRAIGKDEVIPPSASGLSDDDKDLVAHWLPPRFKNMKGLPAKPLAVFPTHIARRISTQRSCFTIHGTDGDGLDRLRGKKNAILVKIAIPSYRVIAIRQELESCGIDEATIYPDLGGLSRSIALRWQSNWQVVPHEGVYTRLRPSRVDKSGVGVFAIRPIPKGTALFENDNEEMVWILEKDRPTGSPELRKLYEDFAVVRAGRYGCPPSFNRLTMAWFLNEPKRGDRPNVGCDAQSYDFFALRNIKTGEELTVDYSKYSESSF